MIFDVTFDEFIPFDDFIPFNEYHPFFDKTPLTIPEYGCPKKLRFCADCLIQDDWPMTSLIDRGQIDPPTHDYCSYFDKII